MLRTGTEITESVFVQHTGLDQHSLRVFCSHTRESGKPEKSGGEWEPGEGFAGESELEIEGPFGEVAFTWGRYASQPQPASPRK